MILEEIVPCVVEETSDHTVRGMQTKFHDYFATFNEELFTHRVPVRSQRRHEQYLTQTWAPFNADMYTINRRHGYHLTQRDTGYILGHPP